ncbi:MAG: hypothetical protein FWF22_06970, partial [Treponema sp.]|nr:hypothetical protein [Treponema sp.]
AGTDEKHAEHAAATPGSDFLDMINSDSSPAEDAAPKAIAAPKRGRKPGAVDAKKTTARRGRKSGAPAKATVGLREV